MLYKSSEDQDNLAEAYKSSAYLSIESTAINVYFQETGSIEIQEESSILSPIFDEKPIYSTVPVKKVHVQVHKYIYNSRCTYTCRTTLSHLVNVAFMYIYMWSMILYMYLYVNKPVQYMEWSRHWLKKFMLVHSKWLFTTL